MVTVIAEFLAAQAEHAEVERSIAHVGPVPGVAPGDSLANDPSFHAAQDLEASDARQEYDEIQQAHKQLAERCKTLASRVRPPHPDLGGGTGATAPAAPAGQQAGGQAGHAGQNAAQTTANPMQVDKEGETDISEARERALALEAEASAQKLKSGGEFDAALVVDPAQKS